MFKIIAIILLSIVFLFNAFIHFLEYRARENPIPAELEGIYDEETYAKWKRYSAEKIRLGIIFSIISYAISLAIFISDAFAYLANNILDPYGPAFAVIGIYFGVSYCVEFVHNYIETMRIEQRYGFNKSSIGTFIADQIKSLIITFGLIFGLLALYIALHQATGDYVLLIFFGIFIALIPLIAFAFPALSKLFNKFTPLEEGELRESLSRLLSSHGYQVRDIKVMDASRRTTKSNAYFAGFGKSKTIVLYDNLLRTMDNDEIVAIFAHEMGHGLHKDTLKSYPISLLLVITIVLMGWLLSKFPEIYGDFAFERINYGFGLILLFETLVPFLSTLFGLPSSALSKRHEFTADEQAVIEGYGDALISALKKLARENFSDLNPDPIVVALYYSHPTLLQRVRHINELKKASEESESK